MTNTMAALYEDTAQGHEGLRLEAAQVGQVGGLCIAAIMPFPPPRGAYQLVGGVFVPERAEIANETHIVNPENPETSCGAVCLGLVAYPCRASMYSALGKKPLKVTDGSVYYGILQFHKKLVVASEDQDALHSRRPELRERLRHVLGLHSILSPYLRQALRLAISESG